MSLRYFALSLALLSSVASAAPDLDAAQAAEAVKTGKVTLIDIRTPPEWKQTGLAVGARQVDMANPRGAAGFLEELMAEIKGDRNAPIALICRTGNRSTQLQKYLQANGFGNVYNVPEGMAGSSFGPGWIKRGLPIKPCTEKC